MSFPYIDLGTRFPKQFSLSKDCLLIYAYVGGFSYRLILKNTEVSLEDSASTVEVELNGDRLLDAVSELALAVNAYSARAHRSTTIVFAVTAKLRYLENRIAEALSALDFADSVTPMPRKELFYRVERELSGTATPTQILFCGEKETSLFSDGREVELPKSRTGGNGFEDYILSFVVNEYEKAAHYYAQVPRLYAIFRAYSYFSREDTRKDRNRIYPLNWEKPALLPTTAEDDMGSPVPYRLLNAEERIKVDRRFRAFYSTPKRGKTHGKAISIAHAATVYEHMVAPIRNETLTSLMLTGAYADFPLLWDFLSSHPQSPEISFVDEATLVFFGMLLAVKARIEHTTLCLIDANGEELLLFGDDVFRAVFRRCKNDIGNLIIETGQHTIDQVFMRFQFLRCLNQGILNIFNQGVLLVVIGRNQFQQVMPCSHDTVAFPAAESPEPCRTAGKYSHL